MQKPWRHQHLTHESSDEEERAGFEVKRKSEPLGPDRLPISPPHLEQDEIPEHQRKKADKNMPASDPPPDECPMRKEPCAKMDPMESDVPQQQRAQLGTQTMAG